MVSIFSVSRGQKEEMKHVRDMTQETIWVYRRITGTQGLFSKLPFSF